MNRNEKILSNKGSMPNRHFRRLGKYSNGFNENFRFFYLISRSGLIDFCGEKITVSKTYNRKLTAKYCFKLFEDGYYSRGRIIECIHPNVLTHVLRGKKGWGLWVKTWSAGCGDRTFHKDEIIKEFDDRKISIPLCFMTEFDKAIEKEKSLFRW